MWNVDKEWWTYALKQQQLHQHSFFWNHCTKNQKHNYSKLSHMMKRIWFYIFNLNSKSGSNYSLTKKQLMTKKINCNTFSIF